MSSSGGCAVCSEPGLVCKGCQRTRYCSREHQKQDWEQHRLQCGHPFEVRTNPTLGRHLVATRLIGEGEVVFKEEPLVFGPYCGDDWVFHGDSETVACTSCCRVLDQSPSVWVRCSRCQLPMCSAACQDAPIHLPECWIFVERRLRQGPMLDMMSSEKGLNIIFIIRCLLANEKKASKIKALQGHSADFLKLSWLTREMRESQVALVLDALGPSLANAQDVRRVQDVVDTNCFQVASGRAKVQSVALYYYASFMSHSCVPNVEWGLSDENTMEVVVRAMSNIRPGDVLTTNYVALDLFTYARKTKLLQDKGFECTCERCMDPTEFGSFISSICCVKCGKKGILGLLVGVQVLSGSADWHCFRCKDTVSVQEVYQYLFRAEHMRHVDRIDAERLIDTLQFPHGRLHPRSSLMLMCSLKIVCQIMSNLRRGGKGFIPSSHDLERVVSLCEGLIFGYNKIIPSLSYRTGTVVIEMHSAKAELVRRRMDHYVSHRVRDAVKEGNQEEGITEIAKDLESAQFDLKRAESILKYLADYREELKKLRRDMFVMKRVWGWTSAALQFCTHN